MLSVCKQLSASKGQQGKKIDICGLHGGSAALFVARLQEMQQQTVCCLVASDDQLESLAGDIRLFTDVPVLTYPAFEIAPYTQLAPDPVTVAARLATLYFLQEQAGPCIVLTSVEAIMRRVIPQQVLGQSCELVMAGEDTDQEALIASLLATGYASCALVRQPGDLAVRGGIVDLFPPPANPALQGPLRLDFSEDTVKSIRLFDPLSQRSQEELEEAILLPGSDILFPNVAASAQESAQEEWRQGLSATAEELAPGRVHVQDDQARQVMSLLRDQLRFPGIEFFLPLIYQDPKPQTLFDYLPADCPCVLHDPIAIKRKMTLVWERITVNYENASDDEAQGLALPPHTLFMDQEEFDSCLQARTQVALCLRPDPAVEQQTQQIVQQVGDHSLLRQEIELHRKKRGVLAPLADRLLQWQQTKDTVILACRSEQQARHLKEMLAGYGIHCGQRSTPLTLEQYADQHTNQVGQVLLVEHPLSQGFDLPEEQLHILSAAELFGDKRLSGSINKRQRTGRTEAQPVALEEISIGDTVVHRDHGLASFQGLVNMDFAGQCGDFMLLEFLGNDRLYVPVHQLHWVSRYQGLTEHQPKLDRLGSQRWQTAKKKVTEAVWQVAQELLTIYARREMRKGHCFQPPGILFKELADSFPYSETQGQAQAIEDVLTDLCSDKPMDRLICGDVGYGKTEVAIRAAYKVIEDGFQVAVLVPTTVLAEQHAATFRERFAGFNVQVACTNRFRTTQEQKEIVRDLKEGRINLVVGTHRLLSKSIKFQKLGLLIVDEEHRFGVSHKEKMKKLRAGVDVLTLTATPIPRTLQMSLLGIRDLSVISSPPRQRRSVKTFLARYDDLVIREAVQQELDRGGQIFFVHNRIQSIHRVAQQIEQLVPHARLAVAHGQMSGKQLEEVMVSFIKHKVDMLVSTTIIESGLDIPNANTIIINRADRIGLADMYQLRGRVGRSSRQSYAYLLVPSTEQMTADAGQRLRALMDCSELGSGFQLAMNDLQIRGGGNLLGVSQSGHIAAVGYDLYLELLQSTVADLKEQTAQGSNSSEFSESSERSEPVVEPDVMLRVAAFLPDDYVPDTVLRYRLYRRLSVAGNQDPEQLADLRDEIRDRFGPIPRETDALFALVGLKYRLRQLGIIKLEQGPANLVFSFGQHSPVAPETLLAFIAHSQPHSQPQLKKKKEARPDRLGRLNKRLRVPTKKLAPEPGEPVRLTPDQRP
ncbi:MAG: transcription-repair coupling factor, partial [Candidatus Electrothrix sp. AW5]|nr:transcription-repair coupling factor [Candidatus Electrothrix gigas]